MNDSQLQLVLLQIWWPYCACFLEAPTLDRLKIEVTSSRVSGHLRLTSAEWQRLTGLALNFQNLFDSAFTTLTKQLDPRSRQYVFTCARILGPGNTRLRLAAPAAAPATRGGLERLLLAAEAPARTAAGGRTAARIVKKRGGVTLEVAAPVAKTASRSTAKKKKVAAKATKKTDATPLRKTRVTKKPRTRPK